MVDKIKQLDTAIIIALMICAVTFLAVREVYTEPVALFFSGLAGYILGVKK